MMTGADVVYDFIFTAKNKNGEYFFNRFIKTYEFINVNKNQNVYTGFAKLSVINKLTARALYKFGKLDLGKPNFSKTVIAL